MHISLDWIGDYVDVPELPPAELARRFTMGTAEVDSFKGENEHLEKILVVQATQIDKHPDADKLSIVHFKVSDKEQRNVVTGATNVVVGKKYPYAPTGTLLPNGLLLRPQKLRGVMSEGMLCSEDELGLGSDHDGIMALPDDAPLGVSLANLWQQKKDILIDIDNKSLTHRPDLWGIYGLAREFAAIFERPLKNPYDEKWAAHWRSQFDQRSSPVVPKLVGESSCWGYFGLTVENITIAESPAWMKKRLQAVGIRAINNIVDISNYVMIELGLPLHIFDRDQIAGNELIIKRVGEECEFVTLDEVKRKLIPSDTVIGDTQGPSVLAGIMGGLKSGVSNQTKRIFIEVANWKAAEVRKTSSRLGLRTDASQRFEKSLDCALMERSMLRTLQLVQEFCPQAKVVGKLEYDGIDFWNKKPLIIESTVSHIAAKLGHPVIAQQVMTILRSLDFQVETNTSNNDENLRITVPSYRATKDVEYEADIIEEVGRIIGYDHITPRPPALAVAPIRLSEAQKLHRKIKDYLVYNAQCFEIMTYPLMGEKSLRDAGLPHGKELKIINALSEEFDRLRPSLIPGLLQACTLNSKNFSQFRFFEMGRSYLLAPKTFSQENSQIGIVFYHEEKSPFMELLNKVEGLLSNGNISAEFVMKSSKMKNELLPENWRGLHPYEYQDIRIMGKLSGVVVSIHPLLLRDYKIKGQVSLAIIDLTNNENQILKDKTKYHPIAKFPSSDFDWTVVANKDITISELFSVLKKVKIKEMLSCKVVDVYPLSETQKTVTLRATFSNPEGTLGPEFLNQAQTQLINTMSQEGFPLKM